MRLVAVLLVISLLAGCKTGFKDIDKRFFVTAMAIDKSGDKSKPYRISLKLGIPIGKIEAGEEKFEVISQEAETISEAIRLLKTKVDKELDYGHTKTFILGKALAEEDITQALDWLSRRRDVQLVSYVALGDPDAESVLRVKPQSERFPGNSLVLTFSMDGVESSYIFSEYLYDFYRRVKEKGEDPFLPVIRAENQMYIVTHTALMDKSRVRLMLTPDETQLLDIFRRSGFHKFALKAKADGNVFTLSVTSSKAKYSIENEGDHFAVQINVEIKGITEESKLPNFSSNMGVYREALEQELSGKVEQVVRKIVSYNLDPIGFGLRYRASRKVTDEMWQQWKEQYPKLQVSVQSKVTIEGTGVIR